MFQRESMINYTTNLAIEAMSALYGKKLSSDDFQVSGTRKEFEGDVTIVCFPLGRYSSKNPVDTAHEIGAYLVKGNNDFKDYNVVKGFLNLSLSDQYWFDFLYTLLQEESYGKGSPTGKKYLVEFCSPNTNKPLHLGHIRNILLGDAVSRIRSFAGHDIARVQIINDRGIAICKSMLAWKKYAEGDTPSLKNIKSDHFVGAYYVLFEKKFQEEYQLWQGTPQANTILEENIGKKEEEKDFFKRFKNEYFNKYSVLGRQAKEMLLLWEQGDQETLNLWNTMNQWVYDGFNETYAKLNVYFDKLYFESQTYLRGKELVKEGLENDLFYQEEDGSIWANLENAGLDRKILLRSDGTSVYITQDLGTADMRYDDYKMDGMAYVVADEQNYHFKVLFALLKMLDKPFVEHLFHLSYGMVDLPDGKMKSREGNVVDADDLIDEVKAQARSGMKERGNLEVLSEEEREEIVDKVAMAALKYFIVKVNPQKRMTFNPSESVDMQGQTGPYIQYSHVRINGLLNRAKEKDLDWLNNRGSCAINQHERNLLIELSIFPDLIQQASDTYDPSLIANYCYQLAKLYHKFWTEVPIFKSEDQLLIFRIALSDAVGRVVERGMNLLGIEMPAKM